MSHISLAHFFFFNDTATTEIYTLSLHDALPIWRHRHPRPRRRSPGPHRVREQPVQLPRNRERSLEFSSIVERSEEHTSELQSRLHLVCRLLLEKKKKKKRDI